MARTLCEGTAQKPVTNADPRKCLYPTCPACGRDFGGSTAYNRKHGIGWESIPRHYVASEDGETKRVAV